MKVDLFILQLAIIFLPGIIWAGLDSSFAAKVKPSEVQFMLRAFIFGLICYAIEFLIFLAFGQHFQIADLADASTHQIVGHSIFLEVMGGLAISIVLSIGWLYAARFKLLARALQRVGATKKYGDEDVWDFLLNSGDAAVEYAHFRDFANQCIYGGWVNAFSETDKVRELILYRLIVWNFDGEELYRTPRLYLARPADSIHIEFPYQPSEQPEEPTDDRPPEG